MDYVIGADLDGKTVLEVTRRRLGVSHAMLKRLKFMDNGIILDGVRVTVRAVVRQGSVLSLAVEDTEAPEKLTPVDLPLSIAYEDADAVVPNKPADMPTHQSFGHYGDTVANALAYRYAHSEAPFVFRPVNRLDRNTSGLLLIARNRLSAAFLSEAMKNGRIRKRYLAVLRGSLPEDSGVIDTYMRRTEKSVIVREVCGENEGGDRAITRYTVLLRSDTHTLAEAVPVTGRTHQLRVHFASLGCPIEGDDMYGEASPYISRHALHSYRLSFPKRDGGEEVTVTAPLPDDMARLCWAVFGEEMTNERILPYLRGQDNESYVNNKRQNQ